MIFSSIQKYLRLFFDYVIDLTQKETQDLPSTGLTEVAFEKSLPMVTYLVCFIVCDFTFKEVRIQICLWLCTDTG